MNAKRRLISDGWEGTITKLPDEIVASRVGARSAPAEFAFFNRDDPLLGLSFQALDEVDFEDD